MHVKFWSGNLGKRNLLEDLGIDEGIKQNTSRSSKNGIKAWTGLIWLRIGTVGGPF
jgi:hypothetical protein